MSDPRERMGRRGKRWRGAMTLVEVLAVVVILGLLAATLMTGFSSGIGKGRREIARTTIAQVVAKLELYNLQHHTWPDNDMGLSALAEPHAVPSDAYYLPADLRTDPWNRVLLYVTPGPGGMPFEVLSLGSDGAPGGEGEAADISSVALRENR
ncbi:MAG: type II secretion system protein GspG [Phycisphaeraceae bacterium]|nr:type II secretion system protein GspG [Phycisphaeraceae bacterium]